MTPDFASISIDLAREADFFVGPVKVRPSLRQIESGGESETLEPRVMQVLVALFQKRGEVVGRDELVQRCWAGRVVGEDAISRAITRVRKLGETHGAFTLETIPKVGYRLTSREGPAKSNSTGHAAQTPLMPSLDATGLKNSLAKIISSRWFAPGVAAVLVAAAMVFLPRSTGPDADTVMAQLTERLRQNEANNRDIQRVGAAVQELAGSGRREERTAFEALQSQDNLQALSVLEDLAAKLEARGEKKAAAEVLTRVGAIALIVDQSRGLLARRKALELDPTSLAAFQGLYFDTGLLKGGAETGALAQDMLDKADLSPRMRGWVLAHLAITRSDGRDDAGAAAAMRELDVIRDRTRDKLLEAASQWVGALLALNRDDLHAAREAAERGMALWPGVDEFVSNGAEVMLIRILYARGDREQAFRTGADALDRRSATGDFLPPPIIELVCEAGVFTGALDRAAPYCDTLIRRRDTTFGAEGKAFSGIMAAARGDAALAKAEFAAGYAVAPAGVTPVRLMFLEGWASAKTGDMARAEQLMTQATDRMEKSQFAVRYRSLRAHAWRIVGEGFVAAGQKHKACEPLAKSRQLYADTGGDEGRASVEALRVVAACR